jgi:hypothetical protein
MIFFGTATKRLSTMPTYEGKCLTCGNPTINLTVYVKYFHIFHIPFIPLAKEVRGVCRKCSRAYREEEFPSYFDSIVSALKKVVRRPLQLYIGLIVIVLATAFVVVRMNLKVRESEVLLMYPRVADLYVLPLGIHASFKYVICRVEAVGKDSLTFSVGHDGYAFSDGARAALAEGKVITDSYFEGDLTVARKDIERMLKDESTKPIVRPGL